MKKSNEDELQVYERYILHMEHLNVPKYYGHTIYYKKHWIVTEHINGTDLRQFTTSMAKQAAETIVDIANTFWNHEDTEGRCQRYFERIKKRSLCLSKESRLAKAYDLFLERQKTIPLTLSTGDYLQFNALEASDGRVYAIDWGFGGIMPYALDVARMIVHGSEEYRPFPFYMNNELRKKFVDTYYSKLKYPPDRDTYIRDICLAALNECIEFMENDLLHNRKTDIDYTVMANALADRILEGEII